MNQFSMYLKILFFYLECLFLMTNVNADFSLSDGTYCDGIGWVSYKDEKCFKLIQNWVTRDAANNSCAQEWLQTDSTVPQLVSIKSAEEQDFLTKWVFVEEEVMINVWIGAKRVTDSKDFVWDDGSDVEFTNWVDDAPSDEAKSACVVMQSKYVKGVPKKYQSDANGKWKNMFCGLPSYFICEKLPRWSVLKLQQTLLGQRKELDETKNQLVNLKQTIIPIGFIYAQLPKDKSPTEIWPWMTWTDVSASYAGVFFRINGGGSASFGQTQLENFPRITRVENRDHALDINEIDIFPGGWSGYLETGTWGNTRMGIRFHMTGGEVRPRNMAIRVWKRIA